MRDLVKRILKEQEFTKVRSNPNTFGCYLFHGTEKKFCIAAIDKIENNRSKIKKQFKEILGLGLEDIEIKKKLLKYEKNNPFFLQSRKNLFDFAKKITESCDIAKVSIENEIKDLNNKILVTFINNQKQTYHLINRLDTNSIALAYLLTIFRRNHSDKKPDEFLVKNDFINEVNKFYDKYFNVTEEKYNEGQSSIFFEQVFKYLGDDVRMDESLKDSLEEALYVIKNTRDIGLKSEEDGFNYLNKKYPKSEILSYAGDFDFVDMIGVDGVMKSKRLNQWVPIQIKSKISSCYGNYRFCENMCIGKNDKEDWVEMYYDGTTKINPFNLGSNIPSSQDF
jgi:hypothetical protein